jgi:hypothetical protein
MSSLDTLARTLVDAHRRAATGGGGGGGGGGGTGDRAADAAAASTDLVAALERATPDEIGGALRSAAGSAGLFKVSVGARVLRGGR